MVFARKGLEIMAVEEKLKYVAQQPRHVVSRYLVLLLELFEGLTRLSEPLAFYLLPRVLQVLVPKRLVKLQKPT